MDQTLSLDKFYDMDKIKANIRQYTARGQFHEGMAFISGLTPELQADKSIIVDITELYLVQGHYRLAEKASSWDLCETTSTEDNAALQLLRAFIGISRHCLLNTALETAERVGDLHRINLGADDSTLIKEESELELSEARVSWKFNPRRRVDPTILTP